MNTPLALSSAQMLTVTEVVGRLPRHRRGEFLQTVAALLRDVEVGTHQSTARRIGAWRMVETPRVAEPAARVSRRSTARSHGLVGTCCVCVCEADRDRPRRSHC
jgi:hypothetical protein